MFIINEKTIKLYAKQWLFSQSKIKIELDKYLSQLNDAQLAPTLQKDGPMIVIAGAGSGKTRVLTYRIAYLMS